MKHMKARWIAVFEDEGWHIKTDDEDVWYICEVEGCLPNDDTGEIMAKLICDMHNAALDKAK